MNKFIVGAVIGGAVSAAASVLLTPKKGAEVRSEAQVKYHEIKEKTTELIQKMKEKTAAKQNEANETAIAEVTPFVAETATESTNETVAATEKIS